MDSCKEMWSDCQSGAGSIFLKGIGGHLGAEFLQRIFRDPDAVPDRVHGSLLPFADIFRDSMPHRSAHCLDVLYEVDPKGWTKFGRRLDGAAG